MLPFLQKNINARSSQELKSARNALASFKFLYDGRLVAEQTMTNLDIQQSLKSTVVSTQLGSVCKISQEQYHATFQLVLWYPTRMAFESREPNEHPQKEASNIDVPAQRAPL